METMNATVDEPSAMAYVKGECTLHWKVYSVICSTNYSNGENQVVSKSFAVTTADASDKCQQQQDSTSSTSTLATAITADGNFDLGEEWKVLRWIKGVRKEASIQLRQMIIPGVNALSIGNHNEIPAFLEVMSSWDPVLCIAQPSLATQNLSKDITVSVLTGSSSHFYWLFSILR
ncbi:hypothetical protein Tco_1193873 [Tanacetum coccineum]